MRGIVIAAAGVVVMAIAGYISDRAWEFDSPALAQAAAYAGVGIGLFGVAVGAIVVGLRLGRR